MQLKQLNTTHANCWRVAELMWHYICVKGITEVFWSCKAFYFETLKNGSWKKSSLTTVTTSFPHSAVISINWNIKKKKKALWKWFQWKSRHWAPVLYCPMKPLTPISAFSRWGQLLLVSFPILPCCVQVVSPNSPLPFSLIKPSKKRLSINGYFIKLSRNKQVHLSKQT